jgi:hypothetical protein
MFSEPRAYNTSETVAVRVALVGSLTTNEV